MWPFYSRFEPGTPQGRTVPSGFAGTRHDSDEEEVEPERPVRAGGVAIAPPPSLQESTTTTPPPPETQKAYGASVAAKIMAKYGFKVIL